MPLSTKILPEEPLLNQFAQARQHFASDNVLRARCNHREAAICGRITAHEKARDVCVWNASGGCQARSGRSRFEQFQTPRADRDLDRPA